MTSDWITNLPKADQERIIAMREGGAKLSRVKQRLAEFVVAGKTFEAIEAKAQELIKAEGAVPSFSTVPGYHWATCLMINEGMCHGIPQHKTLQNGDVLKIDVGLIWKGYHLDTTTTVAIGEVSDKVKTFLEVGQRSLKKAINKASVGNTVYDISAAMQRVVEGQGYSCVYQLCGHGIGKELHAEPEIPCLAQKRDKQKKLKLGQTIAVEIMYAAGNAYLEVAEDGWTYETADGSLAGMFEETVLIGPKGPEVLT